MLNAQMSDNYPSFDLIEAVRTERFEDIFILLVTPNTISSEEKTFALSFSAGKGNLLLTQTILFLADDISVESKGAALEIAAAHDRLQIVEMLLAHLFDKASTIPVDSLDRALASAMTLDHLDVARTLINYAGHLISSEFRELAIQRARLRERDDNVVPLQALFQPVQPVISPAFTTKRKEATQDAFSSPTEEEALEFERAKMPRF